MYTTLSNTSPNTPSFDQTKLINGFKSGFPAFSPGTVETKSNRFAAIITVQPSQNHIRISLRLLTLNPCASLHLWNKKSKTFLCFSVPKLDISESTPALYQMSREIFSPKVLPQNQYFRTIACFW